MANDASIITSTVTSVLLIQSTQEEQVLRNFLGRTPGLEVMVAQLTGNWAAKGLRDAAQWLRAKEKLF